MLVTLARRIPAARRSALGAEGFMMVIFITAYNRFKSEFRGAVGRKRI